MTPLLLAVAAAYGTHLVWTAHAFGWSGAAPGPRRPTPRRTSIHRATEKLRQAGLERADLAQVAGGSLGLALAVGLAGVALFGGLVPGLALATAAAMAPTMGVRDRRRRRSAIAREAWPRLIEEIRARTTAGGRSIPQATFEAASTAPAELRPAFAAAEREWLLTTDLDAALRVLRDHLADPTADAVCETLVVAHELGGPDLGRFLRALADDRRDDLHQRRDAQAAQAGVRFARRFVLLVPAGMALAGSSIGSGRAVYATASGQVAVCFGLAVVGACWSWAGRMLRLPHEERVFA